MKDQGIDPADFDKGFLDKAITAAILETVGGTGAAVASTVGSSSQDSSAESVTNTTGTGGVSTYDDLDGALTNLGGDTQTGTITQDKFYDVSNFWVVTSTSYKPRVLTIKVLVT